MSQLCTVCGAAATRTLPLSSHWRRVHPTGHPDQTRLHQVPDPPACERHWEAFLHNETVAIGWCVDCETYGALATVSRCGRLFEAFTP